MARIRTIKPEFWGDEKMAPLSPITRLVFLGLISMADDRGRLLDNIKRIDAFIFPDTSETAHRSITDLSAIGRIRRGQTASGQPIIEIVNWRHQKIERPNYLGALSDIVQEVTPDSPINHRSITDDSPINHRCVDDVSVSVSVPVSVPVSATSIDSRRAGARRPGTRVHGAGEAPKFPHFPASVCDAAYQAWQSKAGAVPYARFRKAFAPLFTASESDRPAAYPRDAELAPAVGLYLDATFGQRDAAFRSPEKCAASLSGIVDVLRSTTDGERRLDGAQMVIGVARRVS